MGRSSVRNDSQRSLPPMLLPNSSPDESPRRISSDEPEVIAARLFDAAVTNAKLTNYEIATLTGVSESLVTRWRSENYRESPSFLQMVRLPPAFHLELHRAMNLRHGFGRQILARLMNDLSDLALVVER
jgi:hypothetical protein